ncbi:MAG: hypothetical protein H7257_12200 [Taibaiella sp.]|nr:hypothetical protein [Taibaiella sp.]
MKKQISTALIAVLATLGTLGVFSFKPAPDNGPVTPVIYQYKQITAVESIVPGGAGRSRILTTDDSGQMIEKDLKNFYSLVGINFDNISNNDRAIVDRINYYSEQGWELTQVVTSGNQQMSNGNSSGGIFITRYIFRKAK